ncbi:MAG TPA: diguanylate cyclase [Burkholderiales bacterium]|nr:diguanylate cyclase [Burkholderiales bacterium]
MRPAAELADVGCKSDQAGEAMPEVTHDKLAEKLSTASNPFIGLVATLALAALVELISKSGLAVHSPAPVLIFPVIFSAVQGGLRTGLASALLAALYFAYFFSLPGTVFHYDGEGLWYAVAWSAATLAIVPLIAFLQKPRRKDLLGMPIERLQAYLTARRHAGQLLLDQGQFLQLIVERALDSMSVLDSQGVFQYGSPSTYAILGYAPGELLGKVSFDYIHPDDVDHAKQAFQQALETGVLSQVDLRARCKDGGWKVLEVAGRAVRRDGEILVVANTQDVTDLRRDEALIAAEKNLFEMIAKDRPLVEILDALVRAIEEQSTGMLCSVLLLHADGVHLRHGAAPSLPDDYNKAIDGLAIGPQAGSCGTAAFLKRLIVAEDIATDPRWTPYKDLASQYGLRASWSKPIMSATDKVLGTFAAYYREPKSPRSRDLEIINRAANLAAIAIERKQAQTQAEHMAHFDALTTLPNRTLMLDRLEQALVQARRNKRGVALLFIDLDNFKEVNDNLGHLIGDAVLCAVAERLVKCVRQGDTVSRQGGDEFVIILPNMQQREDARPVAQKILDAFAAPFVVGGRDFVITASIGISLYPEHGESAPTLMKNADSAMYRAKELGKNKFHFYGA